MKKSEIANHFREFKTSIPLDDYFCRPTIYTSSLDDSH